MLFAVGIHLTCNSDIAIEWQGIVALTAECEVSNAIDIVVSGHKQVQAVVVGEAGIVAEFYEHEPAQHNVAVCIASNGLSVV